MRRDKLGLCARSLAPRLNNETCVRLRGVISTVGENADWSGSQTTIEIDVSNRYGFNISGGSFSHFSASLSYASKYTVILENALTKIH